MKIKFEYNIQMLIFLESHSCKFLKLKFSL